MKISAFSLVVFLAANLAWGMEETEIDKESQIVRSVTCRHGQEVRKIEAVTHFAGCRLLYTKSKKTSQAAKSRREVDLCLENLAKIQKNLEAAGYKCSSELETTSPSAKPLEISALINTF